MYSQIANHNLTPVGNLTYNSILNDIWGYVDSSGTEYALVGTQTGFSIVSLADPANPNELFFINGNFSVWRDIKTFADRAYVCTEGGGGLLIVNLEGLPDTVTYHYHTTVFNRTHNIWIDEAGYLYSLGADRLNGAPMIYDLNNDPDTPVYVSVTTPNFYSHDAYARGDTLWSANINDGFFTVFDISNRQSPTLLATQTTSRNFTHNIWPSDDGQTVFTTDEKSSAWIDAYDVSDLGDVKLVDKWQTPNPGVVPHNAHVHQDYVVISYYVDGLIILDGSRPQNLVEVARFDTYPLSPMDDFDGAWGAYPFLPSGLIIVSDRQTGLHVLQPNYQRACWLEGIVRDSISGSSIFGATATLSLSPSLNETSDLFGAYKFGTVQAGNYQLTVEKLGYLTKTIPVSLVNGQLTQVDVELVPAPTELLQITVRDAQSQQGIANAPIELRHPDTTYRMQTNSMGQVQQAVLHHNYNLWVGAWGYQTQNQTLSVPATNTLTIDLNRGYKDEFELDLGWTTTGNIQTGAWERAVLMPPPNMLLPLLSMDANDTGSYCLVTGNYTDPALIYNWLDSGKTIISSPSMDLSQSTNPMLSLQYNTYQLASAGSDSVLQIWLSNGSSSQLIFASSMVNNFANWKQLNNLPLKDYLPLSNNMQVHIHANNPTGNGLIKVWIDDFIILDTLGNHVSVQTIADPEWVVKLSPNPFQQSIQLEISPQEQALPLQVVNSLGQVIYELELPANSPPIILGEHWPTGLYFIKIGQQSYPVIKR